MTAEQKQQRLAELEALHASLMAQPALSDDLPPGQRWFWIYGNEVARLNVSRFHWGKP